ncbi:hypothetical protein BH09CHL1_BH09CHL1_29660 [soil metagenome]
MTQYIYLGSVAEQEDELFISVSDRPATEYGGFHKVSFRKEHPRTVEAIQEIVDENKPLLVETNYWALGDDERGLQKRALSVRGAIRRILSGE